MLDLIIKNGSCYIDKDLKDQDIAIKDGKIIKIGKIDNQAKEVFDAKGLTVLPGCIDTQTHFREPGSTDTEDLHSGSRAAIVGGITSVFEMPNTNPPTSTKVEFQKKLDLAKNRMYCNYAFYFGATPDNKSELDGKIATNAKDITDNKKAADDKFIATDKTISDNKSELDGKIAATDKTVTDNKKAADDKFVATDKTISDNKSELDGKIAGVSNTHLKRYGLLFHPEDLTTTHIIIDNFIESL
mgnify:CR=1 FL=1